MNIRNFEHQLRMKREQYRGLKKQWGMTLLEIIIVLAIIGVIAAGVVVLAQRAFDSKAMSDLANNANIVRVAMKDAYGMSGRYPAEAATATQDLTTVSIATDTTTPIGRLVSLGKISPEEGRNAISGNYIDIGRAQIGTRVDAGYYIVLNGLNQKQCRGLLTQLGNQWDYVEVRSTGFASGAYTAVGDLAMDTATNLTVDADGNVTAAGTGNSAIYRSLNANGSNLITPDSAIFVCADTSDNGLILGSR